MPWECFFLISVFMNLKLGVKAFYINYEALYYWKCSWDLCSYKCHKTFVFFVIVFVNFKLGAKALYIHVLGFFVHIYMIRFCPCSLVYWHHYIPTMLLLFWQVKNRYINGQSLDFRLKWLREKKSVKSSLNGSVERPG